MRDRIVKGLQPACLFGVAMAAITALQVFWRRDYTMVLWPLGAFVGWTALVLPLTVSHIDESYAEPLETNPWIGWLVAGAWATSVFAVYYLLRREP